MCKGAAKIWVNPPVPAWNSAIRWAVGKPQPGFCWLSWPKWCCNSAVSGLEKLDPSRKKTR